ncbi:MAG: type II secretion system protein [Fimbriimonadaceae bacterium]|nr:type II secretion system protein [Fimbriimonadaceae bacterium]
MKRIRSKRAGLTLVEVVVASLLSTMVIFGSLSVYLSGMSSWLRGSERINAETQSRQGVRMVSDYLREAMAVTVAGDGMSLTYRLPQKNVAGDFVYPATWDGVTRRLYYTNNTIRHDTGTNDRVIVRNVMTTDVGGTNLPYRIFTPGPGAITRQVTVQVVTRTNADPAAKARARKREVIFLRNIPELTR